MARGKLGTHLGLVVDDYRLNPADPALGDFVSELLLQHKDEALSRMREKYPAQSHPLVLTHPFTGEKVLFSNKVSGVRIEGVDEAESRRILDMVHLLAWRPEYQCRYQWAEGDVAIWDNLATQHYAVSDYWPHVRKMERITLEGEPVK